MDGIESTSHGPQDGHFVIRPVREDDAEALLQFVPQVDCETDHMRRVAGEFQLGIEEERAFLRGKIQSECDLFLVATVENRIVGSLGFSGSTLQRFRHQGEFGMGVIRSHWSRGIGSALLDRLCVWAEQRGLVRIGLKVSADNPRAIGLYQRFGFKEEGRLINDRLHEDGFHDTLIMARVRTEEDEI